MSEQLEQKEVTTVRKRGRRPSTVQELFNVDEPSTARADVVLRRIATADEFNRTITCRPGMITVLSSAKQHVGLEPYRKALLGRGVGREVSIRFGQHDLHPSEIHTVVPSEVIEPGRTVEEALLRAGVPKAELLAVATAVGLNNFLKDKTERAAPKVIARLTTAVAVWSRSRIVYLDEPFKDVGNEWAPTLANYLLESVSNSDRVMILGGIERIPRLWKSSPAVELVGADLELLDGDVQVVDETMGYLRKIQQLIGSSPHEGEHITTYPQRIFRRRTPSDAAMCIEAISNPNLSQSEQKLYSVNLEDRPDASAARRKRKSSHHKLTSVTKLQKLRSSAIMNLFSALRARPESSATSAESGPAKYRMDKFEEQQVNQQRYQVMLMILLLLNAILLLLNWL